MSLATKPVPPWLRARLRRLGQARLLRWAAVICILAGTAIVAPAVAASAAACGTSVLAVVAHQDDSLLFLSPDLLHDIQAGDCHHGLRHRRGPGGGYGLLAGARKRWERGVREHGGGGQHLESGRDHRRGPQHRHRHASGQPEHQAAYTRLPDGNVDGSGWASDNYESLLKLWNGTIGTIHPVDGSPGYTAQGLASTLTSLMNTFQPSIIRTQDYAGYVGDDDHADHHVTAYFTRAASQRYTTPHELIGYLGYDGQYRAQNVSGADLTAKTNAWDAYAQVTGVCSDPSCAGTSYPAWLGRQYITASENAPTPNQPPTANAGTSETVIAGVNVGLNGSGSSDPNGDLVSYQWTQTGGPSVTLSNSTSARPTFTAPNAAATLTFQLVVNDGQVNSTPSSVTITVSDAGGADAALTATATASSQTSVQPATAAIDGIVNGYPNDSTKEWSTNGGGAGSWLKLTWSSSGHPGHDHPARPAQYQRPDHVRHPDLQQRDADPRGRAAQRRDGADGERAQYQHHHSQLTVTSVSASTQNVGLAEIEAWTPGNGGPPAGRQRGSRPVRARWGDGDPGRLGKHGPEQPADLPWTQTAGPSVTLSSATAVKPTFTAPATAATLTF